MFRCHYCSSFTSTVSWPITSRPKKKKFQNLAKLRLRPSGAGTGPVSPNMEKNPSDTTGRNKKTLIVSRYVDWCASIAAETLLVDKSPLVQRWLTEQVTPPTTSFKMVQLFVMKAVWVTNKSLTLQCWEEGTLFLLLLLFSAVRYLLVQCFLLLFLTSLRRCYRDSLALFNRSV